MTSGKSGKPTCKTTPEVAEFLASIFDAIDIGSLQSATVHITRQSSDSTSRTFTIAGPVGVVVDVANPASSCGADYSMCRVGYVGLQLSDDLTQVTPLFVQQLKQFGGVVGGTTDLYKVDPTHSGDTLRQFGEAGLAIAQLMDMTGSPCTVEAGQPIQLCSCSYTNELVQVWEDCLASGSGGEAAMSATDVVASAAL